MSGAGGKWMASSIKEEDIMKLREAGYLASLSFLMSSYVTEEAIHQP